MAKKTLTYLRLSVLIGVPIVLLLLPKDFFDNGPDTCPSRIFFQQECPGCGMTRACMYLIHFDFGGAYYLNAASFAVFPLLAFIWGRWLWQAVQAI
jgi:Protein of unknown function (DUF2752)